MKPILEMSDRPTCGDSRNVTSSPGSVSGPMPCDAPGGLTVGQFGQVLAPANLSARQANGMGLMMSGIVPAHCADQPSRRVW